MVKSGGDGDISHIRTFLRIRPSKHPSGFIKVDEYDKTRLGFHVPVETKDGEYVNNTRTAHNFKFDGVLGEKATQDDVFSKIGKGAVTNVLDGYNSTVFAYGQTGSGKTFTVTGGAERYVDRGIIPRALSLIFGEFKERSDQQFTCHISYLEIYNEQGFDLLDPSHDSKKLEDLQKVSLMEDEDGNIHLRNLSVYLAANEEEALNFLFLGDTNRAISETAMNKASSRSHCIFTISVEGRKHGSEKVMRSKLHLVDLAGSERVHKTQTGGQTLVEAKHINVSLFFLEMVIVALRERGAKGRQHIPYRNSMMTSVLRDSLGGNCKTVMIATVNAEAAQTEESMSTCRFAQRVSTIKNEARVNEDLDPAVMIRRLRSDCAALTDEVAFLKGETGDGEELTSEEAEDLNSRCRAFVEDTVSNAQLSIGAYTLTKLKRCFAVFKAMVLDGRQALGGGVGGDSSVQLQEQHYNGVVVGAANGETGVTDELGGQMLSLRDALQQRDNEIAILVNMLKQGKCHSCAAMSASPATTTPQREGGSSQHPHDPGGTSAPFQRQHRQGMESAHGSGGKGAGASRASRASAATVSGVMMAPKGTVGGRGAMVVTPPVDVEVLRDPQTAFAYFRERHLGNVALEENKTLLGEKYAKAKAMGERVNQARGTIQYLKNTIEQIRRERALDGLTDDGGEDGGGHGENRQYERDEEDEEEAKCKMAIDVEKRVYKGSFQELRELKSEIEHIQRLLEKGRTRIQADFQAWYELLIAAGEEALKNRSRQAAAAPKSFPGVIVQDDTPRAHAHHATQFSYEDRECNAPISTGERRDGTAPPDGGEGRGDNTPTRRPRLPVDAWGTPPGSVNRKGTSKAEGSISMGGGSSSGVPGGPGGANGSSSCGGVGVGGLFPPLTGNKEADDDIAAFYRAKEELERRRNGAGRSGGH